MNTCEDQASRGHCEDPWLSIGYCFYGGSAPDGKIKEDCEISCGNCGEYIIKTIIKVNKNHVKIKLSNNLF